MKRSSLILAACLFLCAALLAGCGAKPTLSLTLSQSGNDLVVQMNITNFTIGTNGHTHLQLDDGPQMMPMTKKYTFQGAGLGKHVVKAVLTDMNHKEIGVQAQAEIEMK